MKINNIIFAALGGGQEVGASCYYLQIGKRHFMFDCGKGFIDKVVHGPNITTLFENPYLTSPEQIEAMFISHAHFDHIGYLPEFAEQYKIPLYATPTTKALGKYLMWDSIGKYFTNYKKLAWRHSSKRILNAIHTIGFNKPTDLLGYKVIFFEAGHIPGAAMILLEVEGKKILYSGDFCLQNTALTKGCTLPANIKPDLLILCGLHAKRPQYKKANNLEYILANLKYDLQRKKTIYIKVPQLTKGLELTKLLYTAMQSGEISQKKFFLDSFIWKLATRLEKSNIPSLNPYCYPTTTYKEAGIYIATTVNRNWPSDYIEVDFTLHSDFEELKTLIRQIQPKKTLIVHTAPESSSRQKYALNKELPEFSYLYPENNRLYAL